MTDKPDDWWRERIVICNPKVLVGKPTVQRRCG